MVNGKIPMSQVRTISGIPDDLWEDARNEYSTISKGIKNLLQKDLRTQNDQEDNNHFDLLKNSDLSDKQLKVARDLMSNGSVKKNGQQLGNVLTKYFADKNYRDNARQAIIRDDNVPFEKDGSGVKAVDTRCPECTAGNPLKLLRKNDFECLNCEKRLYDVGDE